MDQNQSQSQTRMSQSPGSKPGQDSVQDQNLQEEIAQVRIEDLPLEKKLEFLRKFNYLEFFQADNYIDAQDSVNSWCLGQVTQSDGRNVNVHFDGWSNKWDVWQKITSYKIAPFRKYSRGYTGQNKIALRQNLQFNLDDLHLAKTRIEKFIELDFSNTGAHCTTQYLRGQLYIYIDFLLQGGPYTEEQVDAINDLIYTFIKLVVAWLKKMPTLIPLWSQIRVNSDLFLIDENIATIQCGYELMDTMRKIFGGCHRCLKYYIENDKNPIHFDTSITQNFSHINFEENRKKEEDIPDIDDMRRMVVQQKGLVFGQMMNFVNHFAEIGGFDAIIDYLKQGGESQDEKVPFDLFTLFTFPFKNCGEIFAPTFASHYVTSIRDLVVNRIRNMTEKELKEIDKESIGRVLNDLKDFLTLGLSDTETAEMVESNQLQVSLRFLKSTYLEKRLKGISDIKWMIDRLEWAQNQAQFKNMQMDQRFRGGNIDSEMNGIKGIKGPKWLTSEIMRDWILNEKILEIVLGENTHLEIVKRSSCLLKFLAKQDALPIESVDLIWKSQLGKHEEMVRVVYQMIQELVPFIQGKYIDQFYARIQQVPPSQYDEKFLEFLKDFTMKSLESHYDIKHNEDSISETQAIPYEQIIQHREINILQRIGEYVLQGQTAQLADEKQYGLPIFWELIQDKTPQLSQEIMQKSIDSISDILKQIYSHPIRINYLVKSMENIMKGESIVQSIVIAQHIINEFSQSSFDDNSISQKNVIIQLNKQLQLVNRIIENIKNYHLQVKDKVKSMSNQKKQLPDDVSNFIFVGKHSHENILNKLLSFLEFIIIDSNLEITLGPENINILWQIFVLQPNFVLDQNIFLKWINEPKQYDNFIFNEEERKYLFVQILCKPIDVKNKTYAQVKCFQRYFKIINNSERNIEIQRKKMRVISFENLIGLDTLWRMAIESDNEKSRDESIDLLVDLHLKLDQSIPLQQQQDIWGRFIQTCMTNLQQEDDSVVINTIHLLSKFLDRYEGKRTLKPEAIQPQFSNLQPVSIQVMSRNDQVRKTVQMSYFQSLGHLRQKIADAFDLQINEFVMNIRNSFIDPDEDDNKLFKDVGLIQNVLIIKNPHYNPESHPKFLISSNPNNYDLLFILLQKSNAVLIESTWDLLQKLPVNEKLKQEIKDLQGVSDGSKNWEKIMDPKSTNKLLYSLKIIHNLIQNQKDQKTQQWRFKFVQLGGFTHLLKTFMGLEISKIDTNLTLKCVEFLILILHDFIVNDKDLIKLVMDNKDNVILKCINLVDLVTEFLNSNEHKRGFTLEDLQKRMLHNKQKKNKYKSYMVNAKGQGQDRQQASTQQDDEEDKESQEYTQYQQLIKTFQEESQIVDVLFKFLFFTVFKHDPSSTTVVARYQNLENLLVKATIMSDNSFLRVEVLKKFKDILQIRLQPNEAQAQLDILQVLMFKIEPTTEKFENRSSTFFEVLSLIIDVFPINEYQVIEPQCIRLIEQLAEFIQKREIREKNTQDNDSIMVGKMKLLKVLVKKYPQTKKTIGQSLVYHLLHDCLFQVPQGGSSKNQNDLPAPKCKGILSRRSAVQLLAVLCRDCIPNLDMVLTYLQKFNQNPSWRTNKDHDWSISLMDSEKSSTGYVGIKNLGCICYMNSLFQQLFMIKSFRNDLLSVRDQGAEKVEKEDNMLFQLQLLFAGLLKSEKQCVSPKGFCHAFKDWDGNPTNVMEQMDVEEFFNMIMDRIETAIKGSPQQNTIQEHFGGKFASEMICKGCPHKYERSEPFLSISVPVKNKKSILEGLSAFIQGDMLDGDNAYQCEKCDKKVDALKRTCVKKLPKNLIVALRRFEFDYDKMIRVKVNDYCEFPMEFSLEPYTQEGLARREKLQKMKEEKGEDNNDQEIEMDPLKYPAEYYDYQLSGIVVHSGTADSGHYYSFIKDREHPESGKWYELNDQIVRDFDPNDIPQECYGGEDTFQGYNMVQMKSMKWRNAYLLFYERKIPEDMESEEEKESEKSKSVSREDVEMKNMSQNQELDILNEIEEKIAYENQKYWQNRFLFGNEYHEFVHDLALNWNTSCIIPKHFLTKNNDFHLVGYPMPKEYESDPTILDINDVKMPINPQDAQEMEERVFKYACGFYITILQRAQQKIYVPGMINLLKSYINKNHNCASWLLSEFCNNKIIEETLFQCTTKEMRKFIVGLLYCAMLKVYPIEKEKLALYWLDSQDPANNKSVLGNLALVLISNIFAAKKFLSHSAQFFQLIARMTSLGPEIREFFLKSRLIGRLMEFFYDDVSPHKEFFRDLTEINPHFKEKPDIGLPTEIDKKQMSQFQEIIERRRLKQLAEGPMKYKYLFEAVSNCIRAFKSGPALSPFHLDDIPHDGLLAQERDLYIPESKFLKRVFEQSRKKRTIKYVCMGYVHFCWNEKEGFQELLGVIQQGLHDSDYTEVKPFLFLIEYIIQNPGSDIPEQRFDTVLHLFLELVKLNQQFFKFTESMFEFIFKITCRYPIVKEWFLRNKLRWQWLIDWAQETKMPLGSQDPQATVQMYKHRNNFMMNQQTLRNEYFRGLVVKEVRIKRLEHLLKNECPDLSQEIDIDLLDLQDYKFVVGEVGELYYRKNDKIQAFQVENVLDEMIHVKYLNINNNQDNYQNQNALSWISCDQDKIQLSGTYNSQYKVKIFQHYNVIQQQRLAAQTAQVNQQQQMRGVSNRVHGQGPQDEYDMNDGNSGNVVGDSDDDNEDSDENIYN